MRMKLENAGLVTMRLERELRTVGNEVTNGVYRER